MPATRILKQAAKARMKPRDWLLQQLNELQSQHKVAISLGESPAAISRALAEYRIMEVKNYVYRGRHHKVSPRVGPRRRLTPAEGLAGMELIQLPPGCTTLPISRSICPTLQNTSALRQYPRG